MMIRIRLFGVPRVEHHGGERGGARVMLSETSAALLAYLLLNGQRSHSRSALVGRFWGDGSEASARACLSSHLWRLRQALEPADLVSRGTYLRAPSKESVSFNWDSSWWVDALEFEHRVEEAISSGEVDHLRLETAVDLYQACLLEGHRDPWVNQERDRFELLYLEGLTVKLDSYARSGNYRAAVACGRQLLATDPLREDVHRTMMLVYAQQDQRSMVVRQYRWCAALLAEELQVTPLPETQAIYAQLVRGTASPPSALLLSGTGPGR